ncbi:MAG: methyltransferase domain-containing protein [Gemmatimonadaceae bacterium]
MAQPYESFYERFDSPLMQRVRSMSYGEDVGQNSWVTANELRADATRLALGAHSRLLDLGCGPCGPLTFLVQTTGCAGTGLDASAAALASGKARADAIGVALDLQMHDLNLRLPFDDATFDAIISVDVILHVRDRQPLLREAERVLVPSGRLLFIDAGVVTGAISNDEAQLRSANGLSHFVAVGYNESLIAAAGLQLIETEDRTESVVRVANDRLRALHTYRKELDAMTGREAQARYEQYLQTVHALAARRALSRLMYLAMRPAV